jgi:hypothetical protein
MAAQRQPTDRETQRYLAAYDLDHSAMGPLIASGKQHDTYHYGADKVIKVPKHSVYMQVYGAFSHADIVKDLDLLHAYLPEFVPETTVLATPQHDGYVIIQAYLADARYITHENFPAVRDDIQRIVSGNRAMIRDHRFSVDFFGNKGLRESTTAVILRQPHRALINNMMVVTQHGEPAVMIVDTNLSALRFPAGVPGHWFRWMVDSGCFVLSRVLLQMLFDIGL